MQRPQRRRFTIAALPLIGAGAGLALGRHLAHPLADDIFAAPMVLVKLSTLISITAFLVTAIPWIFSKRETSYSPLSVAASCIGFAVGGLFVLGMFVLIIEVYTGV